MYNKLTLGNGVRVVIENIPYVRSVSIGIWIKTGSISESKENNGISHLIEHMLFKGTKTRSAKNIAEEMDNIGGQLNAFTSKECTCYYAKVLDTHLEEAVDILSDMFFNSVFDETELEKEKGVVFEEINMYEDSPEDIVHDLLSKTIFKGNPLSYPILGTQNSLSKITREDILKYLMEQYIPENVVISIAGKVDLNSTVDIIKKYFEKWKHIKKAPIEQEFHVKQSSVNYRIKPLEQLHLCLGTEGVSIDSSDIYPLLVLNNIFGGSMSSRLFQKVREELGLVYSIYSYPTSYEKVGLFTIYAGMNPSNLLRVSELIKNEVENIRNNSFTKKEISKAKEQLKGNYILGLESTSSRMTALGKSVLFLDKIKTQEEIIEKIDSVKIDDINSIINKIFNLDKFNISYVGKIENDNIHENIKSIFFN